MAELTIKELILARHDAKASLNLLRKRMKELSINEYLEELGQLEDEYRLMCDSILNGMRDPDGEELYMNMLRRIYKLYNDVRLASICKKRLVFVRCHNVYEKFDKREEFISNKLEGYVQDVALASLSLGENRHVSDKSINAIHKRYMDDLFCCLLVNEQWNDGKCCFFQHIVSSPTIDPNDGSLIVSALTLALLNVFDVNKWLALANVYETSANESIRQRALVGWTLTLPDEEILSLFPIVKDKIRHICGSAQHRQELRDLQIQLLICMQTDDDNAKIQREIMPTLIRGNSLRITRNGIEDSDGDSIDNILDSGEAERKMQETEEKINKMMDMKRAGSDIYFGGFSHMKRFSFFYQLSNWFAPFSFQHPDVVGAISDGNRDLVKNILADGAFCDSDKYSFVFALSAVADKLPANVKEMMASGHGIVDHGTESDTTSPGYIRRMYLQDLYRFFNLHPEKKDFANPFGGKGGVGGVLFIGHGAFDGLMGDERIVIAHYLFKKGIYKSVVGLLARKVCTNEEKYVCALAYERLGRNEAAYELFESLQRANFDVSKTFKGLGDSLFAMGRYKEASKYYGRLLEIAPNNRRCILSRSLAMINSGNTQEGMADLFRMDYERANDYVVKRIIAWGYLMEAKPHDAERMYDIMSRDGVFTDEDWLNFGYTEWLLCKAKEAVESFLCFLKKNDSACDIDTLQREFANDREMLHINGVKDYEIKVMLDIINDKIQ